MSLALSRRETRRLIVLVVARIKELVLEQRLSKLEINVAFLENAEPHIEEYRKLLVKRFDEMEKEVLAKIKKPGKEFYHEGREYWIKKDGFDVDKWLFSKKKWYGTFSTDNKIMTGAILPEAGQQALDDLEMGMIFDQVDKLALEFIATNAKNAAWSITNTQYEALRKQLMEGIAEGESIPKLRARIMEAMAVAKKRAEFIARTEMLKSSNRGAMIGMRQSGIVEGKQWLAAMDARTCVSCEEMDGATMPLEKAYYEQGETAVIGGVEHHFDYEEIEHPPLHPDCRCTLLAVLKEVPGWKPAKTMGEARGFALKNLVRARGEVDYGKDICLKGANSINRNLYALTKKYKKRPDFLGTPEGFKKWLKKIGVLGEPAEMGEADAFVTVVIDREGKRRIALVLNPLNYDEYDSMLAMADMAKDVLIPQGWCRYQDINTIIMHEYGHVLDFYKSDWFISNSLKFETDLLKVIVKEDKSIKQLIGGYAESGLQQEGKMYSETWAELFKLYEHDKTLLTGDLINLVEDAVKFK